MTEVKQPIIILNLAGELSPDLSNYFSERGIELIFPENSKPDQAITHLLTKNVQDFIGLKNQYQCLSKNIKIISLSPVQELEDFVGANGKLILQDIWLTNGFGRFILDKFFQDYGGISISDSFPVFKEKGAFNVANPFNTGEYLDRMVHSAFESGVSALSMKTFFDHMIMYLAGLKTKGKVGLPLEITYGNFEDVFGVQLHFFSQDLILEDLTMSLSRHVSKKAEEYLLNVAVDSSDFFDFTFLQEVNKAVVTALWTKDERIKVENRGLLISELSTNAPITQYPTEGLTSFQTQTEQIEDLSSRIVLGQKANNVDEFKRRVTGSSSEDSFNEMVKGSSQEIEEVKRLFGTDDFGDDSFKQKIQGSPISDLDENQFIKGSKETTSEARTLVKGTKELDEQRQMISGSKEKSTSNMVSKTFGRSKEEVKELLSVKSFKDPMPESVKKRFLDHLAISNKTIDEASQDDFEAFKTIEIEQFKEQSIFNSEKHIVAAEAQKEIEEIVKIKSFQDPMPQDFKNRFQDHLALSDKSMKEASQEDFEDFKKQEIQKAREQSILAQDKILVTDHLMADQGVSTSAAAPGRDQKLMALLAENEALKSKMKTLASEVKILKDSRAQMAEIHKKALEATTIATHGQSDNKADLLLKEQMIQKLKEQKVFGDQDTRRYVELMDREKQTLKESKELENKLKKLQIESNQKENFFAQEVEKSQRQLKAKDLVVLKTKESLMKIVDKKDEELKFMQEKLNQTMRALENANPQAQAIYVKDLERKVSNSEKMIEIYKEKLSQKPSAQTEDESIKDENRKLAIINNQMKNQLDGAKREILKLQDRVSQESAIVMGLKADKTKLELAAKKASMEVKKEELTNNNQPALENEIKKLKNLCDFYEGQIKEAQARQRDTDAKYQASLKLQKKEVIAEDSGKGKVGQLENNVRKLTQDLMESKNQMAEMKKESTKLKQEKIALQNQLDNLKKSSDKSKGAAPKKPGTGGKAA